MRAQSLGVLVVAAAVALCATAATATSAEEVSVPVKLQADLLFMIAGHDRNLPARAAGEVRTLVLMRKGEESSRAAAQFRASALARATVAGLVHRVEVMTYTDAAEVAEACRARRIAIVYLAPGFTVADATELGEALDGTSVLTVAASPALVKRGAVLGFDLVSGRTRLLVDLEQAAKQRVAFGSDVLSLMAVSR